MVQRFIESVVAHGLRRLGLNDVAREADVASLRAALNAHTEQLDKATDRIVNVEARVSEFDLSTREAA